MNTTTSTKESRFNLGTIFKIIFFIFLAWFTITFIIHPVITIFKEAFVTDGQLNLRAVSRILSSDRAVKAIKNSVLLAVVLTVTVNIVGLFLVLVTDYFDIKGSDLLRVAFMSTLVFGGIILNSGYLYVYGENGVLTKFLLRFFPNMNAKWFEGFPAVLLVMTFGCTSNHMIFLTSAIRSIDNNVIDAAKNLGASQWQILKDIVLPSLKPVLTTLLIMTFSTGLGAFAAPLMVGGSDFQTISPLILTFAQRPRSQDLAATLSILLGLSQIVLLIFLTYNERKGNYISISKTQARFKKQKIENKTVNTIVHILAYILFVIYSFPPIMIILFSFMNTKAISYQQLSLESFTLEHYKNIFLNPKTYEPLLRSIGYSLIAAIFSVVLMTLVVRISRKIKNQKLAMFFEAPYFIPWLLPAILIALGYILAYDTPTPLLFGNTTIGKSWILPIAYAVTAMPVTIRYIKSAFYSFDDNLEDASRNLGASSFTTFTRIIIPSLMPTLLALVALNFIGSLAEYNMSALLYPPGKETIGIVIQANSSPTATIDGKAINLVYSVLLMIINTIALYLIYGRGSKLNRRASGVN